jgi:septal ring factor EnvC (AmiA/AmiB activator)
MLSLWRPPDAHRWTHRLFSILTIALLTTLWGVADADAQDTLSSRQATEQRLDALKDQIARDESRLQDAQEKTKASLERLDAIKRKIALREELVATYNQRIRELEREQAVLRDTLERMQTRLRDLREEYRARVVHAYKYGRMHDLALILASQSINQMLVRVRYLRRFAQQRQDKQQTVQAAARDVERRRDTLAATRSETESLLTEARAERETLRDLQDERQRVVRSLRQRESELQSQIEQKRAQAKELERRIREMVAAAQRRAEEEQTEAEQAATSAVYASLSASFQDNRGRLPWPADGVITESFGNQVSDYGTSTYHPGILIATNPGVPVRAVFEGRVTGIDFVPGYGTYLVLRHGDYLTVYSNFSSVTVSTGQTVEAGQVLGDAGTPNEPRDAGVFFAVFDANENTSVDPLDWLAPQ